MTVGLELEVQEWKAHYFLATSVLPLVLYYWLYWRLMLCSPLLSIHTIFQWYTVSAAARNCCLQSWYMHLKCDMLYFVGYVLSTQMRHGGCLPLLTIKIIFLELFELWYDQLKILQHIFMSNCNIWIFGHFLKILV